jgi:hypothetical protein
MRTRLASLEESRPRDEPTSVDDPSLGELKARHREDHLCLKCDHHLVCGMAKALDPNLLVTITGCLGFESAERDGSAVCELMPIEALASS